MGEAKRRTISVKFLVEFGRFEILSYLIGVINLAASQRVTTDTFVIGKHSKSHNASDAVDDDHERNV